MPAEQKTFENGVGGELIDRGERDSKQGEGGDNLSSPPPAFCPLLDLLSLSALDYILKDNSLSTIE